MIITHREFIRDIHPTSAFVKHDFPIQPGMPLTFPWLSQMADAYEEWRPKAVVFEFKSTCSDSVVASPGSLAMGSVVMNTNYNPTRQPFVDKRTMENYEGCTSRKPNLSTVHVVNFNKASTPIPGLKWIRTGGLQTNEDLRLYDPATFSIATVGIPVADAANPGIIGELWVAYSIEFFKPKFTGSTGSALKMDHYVITTAAATNFTTVAPFGTRPATATDVNGKIFANALSALGSWMNKDTSAGVRRINFGPEHQGMTIKVDVSLYGTTVANLMAYGISTPISTNNLTVLPSTSAINYNNGASYWARTDALITSAVVFHSIVFQVANDDFGPWFLEMNQSSNILPGGTPVCDVWVTQLNGTPEAIQA